jgi:hypothetical protein
MSMNTKDSHSVRERSRVFRPTFPVESRTFLAPWAKFRSHLSSIDKKGGPGDVRGEIGSQEHDGIGNLLRFTPASERDLAEVACQQVSICKMRSCEARPYQAGTYGVNPYPTWAEFVRRGMQEPEQPGFARVIRGQVCFTIVRIGRRRKYNRAATSPPHSLGCDLDRMEGAREIYRESPVPDIGRSAEERSCRTHTRVHNHDIGITRLRKCVLERLPIGNIG